jgi:hypothetical protein
MDSIERAAILMECQALCTAYHYYSDRLRYDEMINLFAPDGVFVWPTETLRGHQELRAKYESIRAHRDRLTLRHIVANFVPLSVSHDSVEAAVMLVEFLSEEVTDGTARYDPAQTPRVVDFQDRFKRTEAGWRFASRSVKIALQPRDWVQV